MKSTTLPVALLLLDITTPSLFAAQEVQNTAEPIGTVEQAKAGDVIQLAAGTYTLSAPLVLPSGVTLQGAGTSETTITHSANWKPSTDALPKGEMRPNEANAAAYLIRLKDKATDIKVSNLSLRGPQMHGAIFGVSNSNITIHQLRIEDLLYCGVRFYFMKNSKILDCEFSGAGKVETRRYSGSRSRNFGWSDLCYMDEGFGDRKQPNHLWPS